MNDNWFGISMPADLAYLSVVSLHPEALSEKDFIAHPMLYSEMTKKQAKVVEEKYRQFFDHFIQCSSRVKWDAEEYFLTRPIECEVELQSFLREQALSTFVDRKAGWIFEMDVYLEILVFSRTKFSLPPDIPLHLRVDNTEIAWAETNWA